MEQSNTARFAIHNALHVKELQKVHNALRKHHIEHIFLKGPVLSWYLYRSLPKAPLGDIDILIHRTSYGQTKNILHTLGYRLVPHPDVPINRYKGNAPKHQQITFAADVGGLRFAIDLHQDLITPTEGGFPYPLNSFITKQLTKNAFRSTAPIRCWGQKHSIFIPEFLLLYLCLNSFFHNNCTDKKITADIAALAGRQNLDWAKFITLAKTYGLKEFIYFSLWVAKKSFPNVIPNSVMQSLVSRSVSSRLARLFLLPMHTLSLQSKTNAILRFLILNKPLAWKIQCIGKRQLSLLPDYASVIAKHLVNAYITPWHKRNVSA